VLKQSFSTHSQIIASHSIESSVAVGVQRCNISASRYDEGSSILIELAHSTRVEGSCTTSANLIDEIGILVQEPGEGGFVLIFATLDFADKLSDRFCDWGVASVVVDWTGLRVVILVLLADYYTAVFLTALDRTRVNSRADRISIWIKAFTVCLSRCSVFLSHVFQKIHQNFNFNH